jgi:hypothetical protein
MQLCVHSNVGNNNFYEIKSKYKDRYMLMHSCCCTFILCCVVSTNSEQEFKSIQNAFGKSIWKKKRKSLSLPHLFFTFGPLAQFSPSARSPPSFPSLPLFPSGAGPT